MSSKAALAYGELTQFTIGETKQKCSRWTFEEHLFSLTLIDKANNETFGPWTTQLIACQLHDGIEPIPESECTVR